MKPGERIKMERRSGRGYVYGSIVGVSKDMFNLREKMFIVLLDGRANEIAVHASSIKPVTKRKKDNDE